MITIIYNFFILTMFSIYYFNLDSYNNNHIVIMFLRILCILFNIYIYIYIYIYILFIISYKCISVSIQVTQLDLGQGQFGMTFYPNWLGTLRSRSAQLDLQPWLTSLNSSARANIARLFDPYQLSSIFTRDNLVLSFARLSSAQPLAWPDSTWPFVQLGSNFGLTLSLIWIDLLPNLIQFDLRPSSSQHNLQTKLTRHNRQGDSTRHSSQTTWLDLQVRLTRLDLRHRPILLDFWPKPIWLDHVPTVLT